MRILVVEDDPDLSRQLKDALIDVGYAVDLSLIHISEPTRPY